MRNSLKISNGVNLLVTTTLKKNLTEAKLKPLILSPEVERIFVISDTEGPKLKKVYYFIPPPFLMKLFKGTSVFRWLYKFYLVLLVTFSKRPDLIAAYSFIPHGLNAFFAAKIFRIPVCINIIGGPCEIEGGGYSCDNRLLSRFKKGNQVLEKIFLNVLKGCEFITVTGTQTETFLIKKGIKPEKIYIIPSSIDKERFFPNKRRTDYKILTIGELIHTKRIDRFLKILNILKEDYGYKEIKAAILGKGILEKTLKEKATELRVDKNVKFFGYHTNVEDFLNRSDIFILTSEHEGLSLSVMEAMACGIVPVISGVGDLKDLVIDGFNSRVIDTGCEEDFARVIDLLLKNEGLLNMYSKNARETVLEGFTTEIMAERWKRIFYRVIENKSQNSRASLVWYLNRLSAMSLIEVICRLIRPIRMSLCKTKKVIPESPTHKGNFFIGPKDLEDIVNLYNTKFSKEKERILKIAEDMLSRQNIDWNRQQYLLTLSKAYIISRDSRFAERIVKDIISWIDQNPPYRGINWKMPLETAVRIISWVWALHLTKNSGCFEGERFKDFLNSIYSQTDFIYKNLSFYSSANNHLIGEACVLFIIGVLFECFKDSKLWREKGIEILARDIEAQTFEDGGTKEQAIHYHGFVMDFCLLSILLAEKNNIALPEIIYKRFSQMADFLVNLMDSNGNVPFIGDSDDGFAIRLSEDRDFNNLKSLVISAAILFNRQDFKFKGWEFDEKNLWLFGKKGQEKYNRFESLFFKLQSKALTESGYYVMRSNGFTQTEEKMVFDCGRIGYLSLAAHGHSDCLSITLSIDGREFLIDPGTYLYRSGGIWRDYFRGTRGHNTIRIDQKDQSESLGPFLWGKKAQPFLECWESEEGYDYVEGLHTGYLRLSDPVLHKRQVYFNKRESLWNIYDIISTKKEHLVEIFFHFSGECKIFMQSPYILEVENRDIRIAVSLDNKLQWNLESGSVCPIAGWQSKKFGERIKSTTLIGKNRFTGKAIFNTTIRVVNEIKDSQCSWSKA